MRPRRLAAALLAVAGLVLGTGAFAPWAQAASAQASAERAALACEGGDLDAAASALSELLAAVEAEYGPGHESSVSVRLTLARVEGARGDTARSRALAAVSGGAAQARPVDKTLKRALRKLRTCGIGAEPVRPVEVELSAEEHLVAAEKLVNRGRFEMALEAAKRAQDRMAGAETAAQLRLHMVLAAIYAKQGRLAQALLETTTADQLAGQLGAVEVRIQLARILARAGDLERASASLGELESSATTVRARGELEEARGDLALLLGSPREASAHLELALERHRAAGADANAVAAVLQLQGEARRLAGEFPQAANAYREALALRSGAAARNPRETAMTRNAFGVLQADIGDFRAADSEYDAALAILRDTETEDDPDIITVRMNRALAHWRSDRSSAAAKEYAETVEALGGTLGRDHPAVTAATRNLAHIELERGNEKSAAALLEGLMQTIDENHPDAAAVRLARGRLRVASGQLAEGAADFDAAIAVLSRTRGEAHPVVAQAHTLRARAAVAQGDGATAFREASAASRAIDVHLRRTFGAISDRQRVVLAEASRDAVGALLSVPDAPPRELFVELLPHRDTVLRSIAARGAAGGTGSSELDRKLDALRQRYMAAVLGRGPDAARRVRDLSEQIEGLEQLMGGSASILPQVKPDEVLAGACARLPADAALVKFAAYERTQAGAPGRTAPAYAALVVRGADCSVRHIDLGDAAPIEKQADVFAEAMRDRKSDAKSAREALSDLLLRPLAPALKETRRWLIVPDGSLWGVPIGALPDPEAPDHYLLERVTVGYLTSTYELAEAKSSGQRGDGALLIGAPDFGSGTSGPVVLTPTGPCPMPPFEQLPGTSAEIEEVAALLKDPRVLTGPDVTKARLVEELRRKPWLVHFATHAYFAGRGCQVAGAHAGAELTGGAEPLAPNPLLLSGIVLAGANNPVNIDSEATSGVLTAYEVAGLDLQNAGLVVLSACDTGTGLHLRGQEVQGLRWGFRAAGARALVSSLWQSNDLSTRRMMQTFYESLGSEGDDGGPFRGAEALRRAQLELLEKEQRLGVARPRDWANFIFSGVI